MRNGPRFSSIPPLTLFSSVESFSVRSQWYYPPVLSSVASGPWSVVSLPLGLLALWSFGP